MEIHVSQRMRKTGELIENASCVADVGCDHAYTSMFLIETKKANVETRGGKYNNPQRTTCHCKPKHHAVWIYRCD